MSESPDDIAWREMGERIAVIEELAAHIAKDDCEECEGEGIDWEGDEWTLCPCVVAQVRPK